MSHADTLFTAASLIAGGLALQVAFRSILRIDGDRRSHCIFPCLSMKAKTQRTSRPARKPAGPRADRWSARVMRTSDALDLEPGIFKQRSARAIALSLKRAALASHRRKSEPFRSAMSMLNFQINRGGRGLAPERRRTLERAKGELRKLFGRRR